jgi:hypothetical protein
LDATALEATLGGVFLGNLFTQSGAGAAPRGYDSKVGEFYSLKDFGVTGDGSTDDYGAINTAILAARTAGRTLLIPDGTYKHSGTINWAYNNFKVMALGDRAIFVHSGTGIAHNFSGIANYPASQGCIGGVFGGPGRIMLKGNPAGGTTRVVNIDNWHFGEMKVALRDAATCFNAVDTGIVGASAVCSTFDVRISNNTDGAFVVQPAAGVAAIKLVACTLNKLVVEGCGASAQKAVQLTGCINNSFRGGTIESNAAGGLIEDSTCSRNTYINMDNETNGTGADWTINGSYPVLINCSGAGTVSGSTFGSTGAIVLGGKFQSLTNNDNTLWSCGTEFLTAITNNGSHTTIINPVGGLAIAVEQATSILGNKTINTANNVTLKVNGNTITATAGTATVTIPNATDTLVGKATTDTLTNKTISGASNTLSVRIANDVTGLGTGVATFLGTPSSANLAAALTDEDGTGVIPFEATGTWTPTDQSGASLSFAAVNCRYVKIGNMVHAYGTLTYPATANGSAALIGGLPFTVPNASYASVPSPVKNSVGIAGTVAVPVVNTGTFNIWNNTTATNQTNANLTGAVLSFNISYPVS